MHLTVKFLGDIAEDLVMPLREAIADTLTHHRILQIPLDRLGRLSAAPATSRAVDWAIRTMGGERRGCAIGNGASRDRGLLRDAESGA